MNNIKISVILPIYNSSKYLQQSLESVCNQSLKDIEILCIDDGSSDNSIDILNNFIKIDKRIQLIKNFHENAGAARNTGLHLAKGKYLSFLDADDYFEPSMLENAYTYANKNAADIVIFKYHITDENLTIIKSNHGLNIKIKDKQTNLACYTLLDTSPNAFNKLFRTDFIRKHGLQFQNLTTCNDIFFTRAAVAIAEKIFFLDENLLYYRTNINSISSKRYLDAENIFLEADAIRIFFDKNKISYSKKDFYKSILKNVAYEYSNFPLGISTKQFCKKAQEFFPYEYHCKMKIIFFAKKLHFYIKKLKHCFSV